MVCVSVSEYEQKIVDPNPNKNYSDLQPLTDSDEFLRASLISPSQSFQEGLLYGTCACLCNMFGTGTRYVIHVLPIFL
jgi:hypothetical protein